MGYTPAAWATFGGALAAVAGALTGLPFVAVSVKASALTGLLFVPVSVKASALSESLVLRSRAAETLVLFMILVMIAVVLVAPQPATAIGWQLLALAVLSGIALFALDRRAGHSPEPGVARYVERFSPNTITAILVGVAGVTVIARAGGGLYWLIPAVAASLVGGVINAWLFLVRVPSQ
jgi:hypothetical protein